MTARTQITENTPTRDDTPSKKADQVKEGYAKCEICGKELPEDNLTLHKVHCERIQKRLAEEKVRNEEGRKEHVKTAQPGKGKKKGQKNKSKQSGKGKATKIDINIDELLDSVINDNKLCTMGGCDTKVATTGLFCPNCRRLFCIAHQLPEVHSCKDKTNRSRLINNNTGALKGSGSYTTVQGRSDKIKKAQLKNKLNNKLTDLEKDRLGKSKKK